MFVVEFLKTSDDAVSRIYLLYEYDFTGYWFDYHDVTLMFGYFLLIYIS